MVATEMEQDNQEIIYPMCMYDSDEDQRLPGCLAEEFLVQLSELRVINSSFNAVNYKSDEELNMIYEGSRYSNKEQDNQEVIYPLCMYDSDEDQRLPGCLAEEFLVQLSELRVINSSFNAVNYKSDEELNMIYEGSRYSNKVQDTKAEVLHLQYMYDSDEEDQMFPHRLADDSVVQPHELEVIKLSSNAVNYETDEELNKIDEGFSYSNKDLCEVLPERIRSLYENYFHTDDLIYHRICSCLSPVFSDMLPSNMDDGFLEGSCEPYAKKLLLIAQGKFNIFNEKIIVKAFYEAEKAHREQKRVNGEPYLQHCAETAMLLASIGVNSIVVAAGLLHDSLDDSDMCYDYMLEKFGPVVADLVGGVSMLSYLSQLARDNNTASKTDEAARLHALFLYRADTRAIVIKLADRLHNMMTLDALPCPKRQGIAKETLVIFVPLANRLGISSWKVQLEDLCFRHLHSVKHNEISSKLKDLVDHDMITSAMERLEQALKDKAIPYHGLCRRIKSVYSTHLKMLNKNLSMDELHDIHGIRVIVDCKEDCYEALAVVYQLWPEVPGKFKDYIAEPQRNGYQSLHAVVICKGKIPLEVQIRSKEMHLEAEFGFAAHWIYKEAGYNHLSFVLHVVKWARWVVARHCVAMSGDMLSIGYADSIEQDSACPCHSGDCPYSRKPHCAEDGPVFVIIVENDKMSVQEFRANATIMDLLLVFGGHPLKEELRPRLNYEPVIDPSCKLQMGDLVDLTPAIPDQSMTQYREEIHRLIRTNVQKAFGVSVPPRLCLMRQRKADGNY